MSPAQLQPFYFQCVPRNIIFSNASVPKQGQFKFLLYKDTQKYDQSKTWRDANFINKKMIIQNQKLQFFIHSFIQKHNVKFTLKLVYNHPKQKIIGTWDFFVNDYIVYYKNNQLNRFLQNIKLSQDYSLDIQFFLESSKFQLERARKMYKNSEDLNFVPVKPNQSLKQSNLREEEQVQIYSRQQQIAKIQQFKLQQQMQRKNKQSQMKKAFIKSKQQEIEKKKIQTQKEKQKQKQQQKGLQQKMQRILNNKWLILALIMSLICIYVLGSKYLNSPQPIIQDIEQPVLKIKNNKKKSNKKSK